MVSSGKKLHSDRVNTDPSPPPDTHPGGFEKERELTVEFWRWERGFINDIAGDVGFTSEWHDPFVSTQGLEERGASFFENYLANPQSKLLRLTKGA
jgi:hypothetical protein